MKPLIAALVFFAAWVQAQPDNYAVKFLSTDPQHEFNQVPGCPKGWPVGIDWIGTNTVTTYSNRIVLSKAELDTVYLSLGESFTNWHRSVWKQHRQSQDDQERARLKALQDELDQSLAEVRSASTNFEGLPPGQKDKALKAMLRATVLKQELGR